MGDYAEIQDRHDREWREAWSNMDLKQREEIERVLANSKDYPVEKRMAG